MSLSISFLDQITPENIRDYLVGAGWKPSRSNNDKDRTHIYNCPYKKYAQIEFPLDSTGQWYAQSIDQVVNHLAEIEKRGVEEVINDLHYPNSEIIRYRAISPETRLGTIPLGEAGDLVDAVIVMLQTSVCDVVAPRLKHQRIKRDETEALLKKAQFAQTEHGSYVVKVICPLDAIQSTKPLFDSIPIVRQTTMHLMKVAFDLVDAIDGKRTGKLIDKIKKGDSAQMVSIDTCNAISRTQLSENCTVDLATRWAPALQLPVKEHIPGNVEITPRHFSEIYEMCNALVPRQSEKYESQTEEFIAVVEGCVGDEFNDQGQREGQVVLKVFSQEGKSLKVKAHLTHDNYEIAHYNHGQNKGHFVKIVGSIMPKGRLDEMIVESIEPLKNNNH